LKETVAAATRDDCARWSAFIAVPVLLFFVDLAPRIYRSSATEFLLVPPLAVIIYLIFTQPISRHTRFRSVVILPIAGAIAGELSYRFLGLTPWGVAGAVLVVLLAQGAIRADMPPALALAVLAMLLKADDPSYAAGVAIATTAVWLIFLCWRKFVWLAFSAPA
jgi:hypothetical protein